MMIPYISKLPEANATIAAPVRIQHFWITNHDVTPWWLFFFDTATVVTTAPAALALINAGLQAYGAIYLPAGPPGYATTDLSSVWQNLSGANGLCIVASADGIVCTPSAIAQLKFTLIPT